MKLIPPSPDPVVSDRARTTQPPPHHNAEDEDEPRLRAALAALVSVAQAHGLQRFRHCTHPLSPNAAPKRSSSCASVASKLEAELARLHSPGHSRAHRESLLLDCLRWLSHTCLNGQHPPNATQRIVQSQLQRFH